MLLRRHKQKEQVKPLSESEKAMEKPADEEKKTIRKPRK